MTDKHEDIRKFLNTLPDNFDLMEQRIDPQTQKEYFDYSHSFGRGELTNTETIKLANILLDTNTKIVAKKKALTILAHLGTITAFRQIEKYCANPDSDLKQWSALALQECKMFIESSLTGHNTGFISSGLGSLNNKMRYFFLALSASGKPFTWSQKNLIKVEFTDTANELNCAVETVDYAETYIGLTVLVPMTVAVGKFIEKGIAKCNELGNYVFEHYYVTNQEIPDKSEIEGIIKKIRE